MELKLFSLTTFQLQDEASLTLSCINNCRDGGFEEIFMTKVDFPAKYDCCIRLFDSIIVFSLLGQEIIRAV